MRFFSAQSGFTPTPILVPFRFLKILAHSVVFLVQELTSMKNDNETKKLHQNWCRGFTLVEVLVSIGIFTVLTAVVLSNYRSYDSSALFANASEDIVLALRQAQVYGVGVRGTGTSFATPYGVYFLKSKPNEIVIFADNNSNGLYSSADDTLIETIKWPANIKIDTTSGLTCDGVSAAGIGVTFNRPDPSAIIMRGTPALCTTSGTIKIIDTNTNKFSTVVITPAGQISLQ